MRTGGVESSGTTLGNHARARKGTSTLGGKEERQSGRFRGGAMGMGMGGLFLHQRTGVDTGKIREWRGARETRMATRKEKTIISNSRAEKGERFCKS